MARRYTVAQYEEQIAKLDERIAAKTEELKELKSKRNEKRIAMLEQHNKDLLDYLKTHTNQQGKTYFESFTETMEEQRKTGRTAKNTVKKDTK